MKDDSKLRQHLVKLLDWEDAHVGFDAVLEDWPAKLRGARVVDTPYTAWQLLEHMRLAQWDILEFSRNPGHVSPKFPEGYWPPGDGPRDEAEWNGALDAFRADLEAMVDLVRDPATDLFARIPHGDGQTILREALLVADHNAYHLGQLVMVRRLLGAWPDE